MDSSNFKVVCDHCDAKLASVFCHSDGAFLCPQCDAQVHSVNKLAQRHLRVPCQSCPVWAYREAKSRGRLLDMPLAACLTKNLHLDVFDGASACWPSKNASSVAMGTPQSDASSPQATTAAPLVNAGSPNSEVHATAFHQPSNSWSQNSALAMVTSQPQPMPQPSLGCLSMSQGMEPAEGARAAAALFSISPFSACSGGSLQAAANAAVQRPPQPGPERCSVQGVQASTTTTTAAATAAPPPPQQQQQHISQAAQSQHSQHTLQRAASQELMDAVDSMDVAMLLDTFGAPLDQLQDNSNKRNGDAVQQQQQQQQSQVLPQQESSAQQQQFMAATQQQQQIVAAELLQSQASAMCMTSMPSAAVAATGGVTAFASARRDATVRGGLGLLDPGIGRGRSLAQSPMSLLPVPGTAFASSSCSLLDNLSGSGMNPSSIAAVAAAAAGRVAPGNPFGVGLLPGAAPGGPTAAMAAAAAAAPQPLPGARSLDAAAASSFGALPTSVVGSGGSTSVSPSNCNTLAGAVAERHVPLTAQQLAQQMVLPGSAPPALGLAASVTMGSCDLSESHLMRMSSDGFDGLIGAAATVTGNSLGNSLGMLGLDSDAAGLLTLLERPDGTLKELDPERAAQLNRYKQKRMLRMRALAEGAKKVRYECRKQMADTRPRVRGRFAKVNSSDTLLEFGSAACLPASSSGNNATTTGSVASASACTAPAGVAFHGPGGSGGSGGGGGGGWGLHGHHAHAAPQPHMQRIDEEGISEGQSPLVLPTAGSFPMRQASSSSQEAGTGPGPAGGAATSEGATATATEAAAAAAAGALGAVCGFTSAMITDQARVEPQQQQQQLLLQDCSQRLQRAQSSSMADVARMVDSMQTGLLGSCNNTANTCSTTVIATGAAAAAQGGLGAAGHDCDITEHDLAALGFDELPQLSGGLSNGGHHIAAARTWSKPPSGQVVVMQHTTGVQNPSGALQPPPSSAALPQHQHQHQLQVLGPQQLLAAPQSLPAIASACFLQQAQHQHIQTQPLAPPPPQQQLQPRLSVLDRPIMYGTDRSQFSAAQLSLLDSILTDQYRPSSGGAAAIGRH
ncbi:hypothetical protein VOLCADRAFT_86975 [Volvox carteri f. nagariensis]|uniref:CCT domain-containing protein n=1 Tax=Volvox carteri f. nagariensis TaxID=3068 RepID=D8TJU7_VOLCA|nr:uncharacterized protein VOLCADRAFT_86975 [Volvox carteri f. nagariensis]EFJ52133.1 hypothetical protein VOLCADRAFT_86975 [Volvox carteri f. nagariensis]|eukprot:XP_002946907.1 hypothetical protein VOLCADRAFT_86975 [Volvox carteri f. nagariensis]